MRTSSSSHGSGRATGVYITLVGLTYFLLDAGTLRLETTYSGTPLPASDLGHTLIVAPSSCRALHASTSARTRRRGASRSAYFVKLGGVVNRHALLN